MEEEVIDGCGHWRVHWDIVLPMSRPIRPASAISLILANWNYILAATPARRVRGPVRSGQGRPCSP